MNNKNGFTLVELIATIAILAIVTMMTSISVIKYLSTSKINEMKINENRVLDAAKLYIEDYCNHPISKEYKCEETYSKKLKETYTKELEETYANYKYICLSKLKELSYIKDISYNNSDCSGIVLFDENGNGKTYLLCGDLSTYEFEYETNDHITENKINYKYFECLNN